MRTLKPIRDRVIVRIESRGEETSHGLIIPDTVKERPLHGVVESVGEGGNCQMPWEPGERVLFAKYAGYAIEFEGVSYMVLHSQEILGAFEKKTA